MTPGETTLLKIVAHTPHVEAARKLFHEGFPTSLSEMAFHASVKNLIVRGFLCKSGDQSLSLTELGKEALDAELRGEEKNMQ